MRTEDKYNELRDEAENHKQVEVVEISPKYVKGRKVYACERCNGRCFSSREYLKQHYRRRHPEIVEAIESEKVCRFESDPFSGTENTALIKKTEELKTMQEKLDDLIDKTALTLKLKERSDELILKEREIMSLREIMNDLRNKYLSIQNQVFSLEEIQRNDAQRISRMTNQIQEYESLLKEQALREEKAPIEPRRIGRMIFESLGEINIPRTIKNFTVPEISDYKDVRDADSQTEDCELTFSQFKVSIKGTAKKLEEKPSEDGEIEEPKKESELEENKVTSIVKESLIEEQPINNSHRQDKMIEENKTIKSSTIGGLSRARDKEFRGDESFREVSL